jgi:hypothetical protein
MYIVLTWILSMLAAAFWVWGLIRLIKYWSVMPPYAQAFGIVGLLFPFGALVFTIPFTFARE